MSTILATFITELLYIESLLGVISATTFSCVGVFNESKKFTLWLCPGNDGSICREHKLYSQSRTTYLRE
jgi:hypothetical protein